MRKLQDQLLAFAHPKNLGKIYPMDVGLTLAERSQIRMICREINIHDYDRPIPPWLREGRKPTREDTEKGQTRVRDTSRSAPSHPCRKSRRYTLWW